MKKRSVSLWQKLWFTISITAVLGITGTFAMAHYFYQKLYVGQMEIYLKEEGLRLAGEYNGGDISAELKEKFAWYGQVSQAHLLFVNNPRELSACLPFEVDYESLISSREREQLLNGEIVTKIGYEKRFDRHIMGVIVPLLDDKKLKGILYLYIPLAKIHELYREAGLFLAAASLILISTAVVLGRKIVKKLVTPLNEMERIAHQMSNGDFSEKVIIHTNDEIGRLGQAFNQMADAIREEEERRREFLSNVSHELRTPLSYIKGYSEAMLDGTVTDPHNSQKYLRLIHQEASRMQRLVRDLLDLAQMEGKSMPVDKQPIALAQLIEEELEKCQPFLKEKNLTLAKKLDPDVIIMGDSDRLGQVIQNIMDNAIRYSYENRSIHVTLESLKGNRCQITIQDHGIGIPKEHLHRIGERFYRVDKARSRQYGGTGLGMAIVKKIVQLHDGTLQIDSEEGKGTTVTIQLPTV